MGWSQGYRPKRKGEGWYNTMSEPLRRNPEYDDAGNGPGLRPALSRNCQRGDLPDGGPSDMVGGAAINSAGGFAAKLPKR